MADSREHAQCEPSHVADDARRGARYRPGNPMLRAVSFGLNFVEDSAARARRPGFARRGSMGARRLTLGFEHAHGMRIAPLGLHPPLADSRVPPSSVAGSARGRGHRRSVGRRCAPLAEPLLRPAATRRRRPDSTGAAEPLAARAFAVALATLTPRGEAAVQRGCAPPPYTAPMAPSSGASCDGGRGNARATASGGWRPSGAMRIMWACSKPRVSLRARTGSCRANPGQEASAAPRKGRLV